ncbi:DUF3899 domain-containing protein [Paenibacillus melissococcoides]|uniref:DUF3899 domain-containing protein n=1 Tax=Paenibacillus melissococcoides TaxID=2912268 RepID=A0ABM9G5B9_9BACL|nr:MULTISPECIES: DUF3899 domain-containing protein [Paenibacillus]MEB9892722.1 DUF3899 domain-containing protein [Bacillus cereus]CAH8247019.1 DUF3899 domain-containing protein [Paenibacillus melissococcoides]CAH8716501.1 DUF3899 domain-containing protein [Paenibacillus melissococcoides]CAH8717481.1 DUF3899 domain-containing protein [Paenibacillus melissococcoides]
MKRLSLITLLLILAYLVYNSHVPILVNLSNSFFIIGLVYLCIALFCHVRNIGFFKAVSYHLNHKRQAEEQAASVDAAGGASEPVSKLKLHEHAARIGSGPWPNRLFYLLAIPLLLCSLALAYAST